MRAKFANSNVTPKFTETFGGDEDRGMNRSDGWTMNAEELGTSLDWEARIPNPTGLVTFFTQDA